MSVALRWPINGEGDVNGVNFWLEKSNTMFTYEGYLGDLSRARHRLVPGAEIRALVTDERHPEIWSLEIEGAASMALDSDKW